MEFASLNRARYIGRDTQFLQGVLEVGTFCRLEHYEERKEISRTFAPLKDCMPNSIGEKASHLLCGSLEVCPVIS
jgi:hypothetical protein